MKVAGFEMDAYYDEHGILRMKTVHKQGRKRLVITSTDAFPGIRNSKSLKNLLNIMALTVKASLYPRNTSFEVFLEIVRQYFQVDFKRITNPKTGRITKCYSQRCYDFAYALWYLKMR